MFVGSRITVDKVAGTDVEMVQQTDYPWSGKVSITVNPKEEKEFTIHVRVPDRETSKLYTAAPTVSGLKSLAVNQSAVTPKVEKGYAVIARRWKAGDRIDLELPMAPQRIKADERIKANVGRVALRYGPLIYNVERADQDDLNGVLANGSLTPEWQGGLLGGVMTLKGKWSDGKPMTAIPNFARMNRLVENASDTRASSGSAINYAPGATTSTEASATNAPSSPPASRRRGSRDPQSIIWIKDQP
jgi:DUF1680 family protein